MLKKIFTLIMLLMLMSTVAFAGEIDFTYDKKQNLTGKIIYPDNIVIPKYIQKEAKNTGKTPKVLPPVIVYLPEKTDNYREEPMRSFLSNGYAVAIVNHSDKFPKNIMDSKAAIRYIKANAKKLGVDSGKVGVWGGNTAAFVAVTPYHPEFEDNKANKDGESGRVTVALLVSPCLKDTPTRFHEVVNYVDASASYAFIVNSTTDRISSVKKAETFANKLKNAIGFNNVVLVKSNTASSEKYMFNESTVKKIIDFFNKKFHQK